MAEGETNWREAFDGEGRTYYYDEETGETRWEKPERYLPAEPEDGQEDEAAAEDPYSISGPPYQEAPVRGVHYHCRRLPVQPRPAVPAVAAAGPAPGRSVGPPPGPFRQQVRCAAALGIRR